MAQWGGNLCVYGADPWPTCDPSCHHHPARQHVEDDPESRRHRSNIGPMILASCMYLERILVVSIGTAIYPMERMCSKSIFHASAGTSDYGFRPADSIKNA